MAEKSGNRKGSRKPLSREQIFQAAIGIADDEGVSAVTMRRLGRQLGVEAMSLYHHVANREELLDGMVDQVFAEIELPIIGAEWKAAMRDRAISAREALRRHPWATALMDSRTSPGSATLQHHNSVIGNLRQAGFSVGDGRPCVFITRQLHLWIFAPGDQLAIRQSRRSCFNGQTNVRTLSAR